MRFPHLRDNLRYAQSHQPTNKPRHVSNSLPPFTPTLPALEKWNNSLYVGCVKVNRVRLLLFSLFEWLRVVAIKSYVFDCIPLAPPLSPLCHAIPFPIQCTLVYNFVVIAKDALHIKIQNEWWKRNFSIWIRISHIRAFQKRMSCLRFCPTFLPAHSQFFFYCFIFVLFIAPQWVTTDPMLYWHSFYQLGHTKLARIFAPLRINSIAQWYCLW